MPESVPTLITVKEAAALLGLDEDPVRYGTQGTASLTRVHQGKRIFLIREEVEDFLRTRRETDSAPEGKDEG